MNKKIFASTVFVALLIVAVYSSVGTDVSAKGDTSKFAEEFANEFGLSEEEVQNFIDEMRADRFAQVQEDREERLRERIENGDLTEEQMQEILDMHAMHVAELDSYQYLSIEEREDMLTDHHNTMKIWADENGIDLATMGMHR